MWKALQFPHLVRTCVQTISISAATVCLLYACSSGHHTANLPSEEHLLFSFERRTMLPMVGGTAPRSIAAEHATEGKHSLRLKLSPRHETVILDTAGFPMDWRGWRTLKLDVFRKGSPIAVNLRLTDVHQKRCWIWNRRIQTGANTLQYDLSSIKRQIDLSAITELMWYAEQPSGEIYMDAIRLSR
jgi:hypothetical protein